MNSTGTPHFLPGVPKDHVLARLKVAGGKELEGKFESPESSAALAVNTFGWFIGRANDLPPLPGMRLSERIHSAYVPRSSCAVHAARAVKFHSTQ